MNIILIIILVSILFINLCLLHNLNNCLDRVEDNLVDIEMTYLKMTQALDDVSCVLNVNTVDTLPFER